MTNSRIIRAAFGPAALAVFGPLVAAGVAAAQSAPAVADLRASLDRTRQDGAGVAQGAFESVAYQLDVAERIQKSFPMQSEQWRNRAAKLIARLGQKVDPFPEQRGKILMRGYRSPISTVRQGYAIYIPPGYDSKKAYPLMLVMHGGSANGNLFLGVVLGNNMNWKEYPNHLWDEFTPRWTPDWIVVAPDGYGQIMWRWMGEQDVLDVIDDVQRNYHVDADRIVLGGLSNGGAGAYSIGLRHAWRFATVTAIAGAPSWIQYAGGPMLDEERASMRPVSGLDLAENAINTDFRYYHGRRDAGPMRPIFVEKFTEAISKLGVPFRETWYDMGHDLLYFVHGHGAIYERLASVRRRRRPAEVRVVTGDYRANRQHWVTVTRIARFPELARVRAKAQDRAITVETDNTLAFSLDLDDAPLDSGKSAAGTDPARIVVDGTVVYDGPRQSLGRTVNLVKDPSGWKLGSLQITQGALEKQPGSSGPITDAYFGGMIHVYGTLNPKHVEALKQAAERGSRGWPLWLWNYRQPVVADTEVTEQTMREFHLVLYATAGDNRVLERIKDKLPIRLESDAVSLGPRRFAGRGVGVKYIYPNPLSPQRYIIVQGGVDTDAVMAGHNLPDFLPDYIVYDRRATRARPRLIFDRDARPLALGYFDRFWRLPAAAKASAGQAAGDESPPDDEAPTDLEKSRRDGTSRLSAEGKTTPAAANAGAPALLPVPPAPPVPAPPIDFLAPKTDPAGKIAREIAQLVPRFPSYRTRIPGAVWKVDPLAVWSIRPEQQCLEAMRNAGIEVHVHKAPLPTPVPIPVEIRGKIDGVRFLFGHPGPLIISCEMATRLPVLAKVLSGHGIHSVIIASAYREKPRTSFHSLGLALDLSGFTTREGEMITVLGSFERTPGHRTCEAPRAQSPKARVLTAIACELAETKSFSTVITPNYNIGHRDHFHIDARPDDPRIFVR